MHAIVGHKKKGPIVSTFDCYYKQCIVHSLYRCITMYQHLLVTGLWPELVYDLSTKKSQCGHGVYRMSTWRTAQREKTHTSPFHTYFCIVSLRVYMGRASQNTNPLPLRLPSKARSAEYYIDGRSAMGTSPPCNTRQHTRKKVRFSKARVASTTKTEYVELAYYLYSPVWG